VSAALSRRERVQDLREFHGAVWVESPAEMLRQLTPEHWARLGRLRAEQMFLLDRLLYLGKPSARLDPALAADPLEEMAWCVACAIANRRLLHRVLEGA
jgi:hypothetical protein